VRQQRPWLGNKNLFVLKGGRVEIPGGAGATAWEGKSETQQAKQQGSGFVFGTTPNFSAQAIVLWAQSSSVQFTYNNEYKRPTNAVLLRFF
jgi:hypothetical protein